MPDLKFDALAVGFCECVGIDKSWQTGSSHTWAACNWSRYSVKTNNCNILLVEYSIHAPLFTCTICKLLPYKLVAHTNKETLLLSLSALLRVVLCFTDLEGQSSPIYFETTCRASFSHQPPPCVVSGDNHHQLAWGILSLFCMYLIFFTINFVKLIESAICLVCRWSCITEKCVNPWMQPLFLR